EDGAGEVVGEETGVALVAEQRRVRGAAPAQLLEPVGGAAEQRTRLVGFPAQLHPFGERLGGLAQQFFLRNGRLLASGQGACRQEQDHSDHVSASSATTILAAAAARPAEGGGSGSKRSAAQARSRSAVCPATFSEMPCRRRCASASAGVGSR